MPEELDHCLKPMTAKKNAKKSPFPGMDPYLERHWGDVHTRLMVYISNQINAQLPDELQARVEESTAIQIEDEMQKTVYPDVRVVEDAPSEQSSDGGMALATQAITTAKPIIIKAALLSRTQRTVEIVDISSDDRVVTAIEVLSPGNKIGLLSRSAYIQKRNTYTESGVNLVEIDLVREGLHIVAIPKGLIPQQYQDQSLACVRRASKPSQFELYPMPLPQPLPDIAIPLRRTDQDVLLQTQALIDQCYQDGRYWRTDYLLPLRPCLPDQDARWVETLLANSTTDTMLER